MSDDLSTNAQRVQDALRAGGLSCKVVELPASTRTALEAAEAVGCSVGQIVKSLIFRGAQTQRPILILTSGTNRIDESKVAPALGEPIEKAAADFVRERTGFAIGGVPPVGHKEKLLTYIDEDLFQYKLIWAAAGTDHSVFQLSPEDLKRVTGGRVVPVK